MQILSHIQLTTTDLIRAVCLADAREMFGGSSLSSHDSSKRLNRGKRPDWTGLHDPESDRTYTVGERRRARGVKDAAYAERLWDSLWDARIAMQQYARSAATRRRLRLVS